MAIQTNFSLGAVTVQNAYLRIENIEGSKDAGYYGTLAVYDCNQKNAKLDFRHKRIPYVPGDPYPQLYAAFMADFPGCVAV